MTDLNCKDILFNFNKASIGNPDIPTWQLRAKGQTFYIWHLEANIPFSTKETPEHPSTKGSIRFRNARLTIDSEGNATITQIEESTND